MGNLFNKSCASEQTIAQVEQTTTLAEQRIAQALQAACCQCPDSIEEIRQPVDASPDAVKVSDSQGCLPLHLACWKKAPLEVIECLVQAWPQSVKEKTNCGSLPLHNACASYLCGRYAVEKAPPLDAIEHLVKQWPQNRSR